MRRLSRILIATALSTLAVSSLTITACAAEDDSVKAASPPYKPGRQIDGAEPVKSGQAPYKPGRQLDDPSPAGDPGAAPSAASDEGPQPVNSGRAPYKPGRQAAENQ